jgi:hypothetical protein
VSEPEPLAEVAIAEVVELACGVEDLGQSKYMTFGVQLQPPEDQSNAGTGSLRFIHMNSS